MAKSIIFLMAVSCGFTAYAAQAPAQQKTAAAAAADANKENCAPDASMAAKIAAFEQQHAKQPLPHAGKNSPKNWGFCHQQQVSCDVKPGFQGQVSYGVVKPEFDRATENEPRVVGAQEYVHYQIIRYQIHRHIHTYVDGNTNTTKTVETVVGLNPLPGPTILKISRPVYQGTIKPEEPLQDIPPFPTH